MRTPKADLAILAKVCEGLKSLPAGPSEEESEQESGEETEGGDAKPPDGPPGEADIAELSPAASQASDPAIIAIRETFAIAADAGAAVAAYFYGALFVSHPGLRDLFPPALDEQRDRLLRALSRIVESLSTPEEMATYLAQLGRDHRKYAVEPSMYQAVGAALVATLREFAGPAFTPAAEEAWVQTYTAASALMIRAAQDESASTPAFWTAEVVEHEQCGHGIAVLTVAPDQVLPYEAGQHVTIQTARWPRVWRPLWSGTPLPEAAVRSSSSTGRAAGPSFMTCRTYGGCQMPTRGYR